MKQVSVKYQIDKSRRACKAAEAAEREQRKMMRAQNAQRRLIIEAGNEARHIRRAEISRWKTRARLCGVSEMELRSRVRPMRVRREIARLRTRLFAEKRGLREGVDALMLLGA